jgi:acetyl-CoA carboxylase biotin carboxylase subunit
VRGALAAGIVGAATFEFLVDAEGSFHFIEINGRIQVEHPVTEMVTGLDLVHQQIRIAAGQALGFAQADVVRRGVAVECRINAEDPERGFAPAPGILEEFLPPGGPFTRVDTHGYPGMQVTGDYDSLLAKVVVWAEQREAALDRMQRALGEFRITGPRIRTTIPFITEVLANSLFREGKHTTSLVEGMGGC